VSLFLGLPLGLAIGARHALEPDHLAAVSTLVAERPGWRRGAMMGAAWGLGHASALAIVGSGLAIADAAMPPVVARGLEVAVALMLIVLGVRALVQAVRAGGGGAIHRHRHHDGEHVHAAAAPHVHLAGRALAWRPLIIGVVHGLAGSGALAAAAIAELTGGAARFAFIATFAVGSIAGMALLSAFAGAGLRSFAARRTTMRALFAVSGLASATIGVWWGGLALLG
jgi:hypothetical protein